MTINTFLKKTNDIRQIEKAISSDRLSTYLFAIGKNDIEKALELYMWNTIVSSEFYIPLQGLEVTLRNNIHIAMYAKTQHENWYDYINFFDEHSKLKLANAKAKVLKKYNSYDVPHIIAELSFGFWVGLIDKHYHQTLWEPTIGKIFSSARMPRSEIRLQLGYLKEFRNRIAHHEPIFSRDLYADYSSVISAIGWLNIEKSIWIEENNDVLDVLSRKPI